MKKRRKIILTTGITLIIIFVLAVIFTLNTPKPSPKICISEKCFNIEIAKTPEQRSQGLMHRDTLTEEESMLFLFPEESIHNFWMKNTLIPLDIIWISKEKKVVHIKHNAQPCTTLCPLIIPNAPASYVLEINAGLAGKYNIEEGDKVNFLAIPDNFFDGVE